MKNSHFTFNFGNLRLWCALSHDFNFDAFHGQSKKPRASSSGLDFGFRFIRVCVHSLYKNIYQLEKRAQALTVTHIQSQMWFTSLLQSNGSKRIGYAFHSVIRFLTFWQYFINMTIDMNIWWQYIFITDKTISIEYLCYRDEEYGAGAYVMAKKYKVQKNSFKSCDGDIFQVLVDISSIWIHSQRRD